MRLIVPHAYNVRGGVERTTVLLIRELAKVIDKLILILPEDQIPYFQRMLPPSETLVYEAFNWPRTDRSFQRRLCEIARNNLLRFQKRLHISYAAQWAARLKAEENELRIRYLVEKHKATHCLYMITGGQRPPKLSIPLAVILYDVFWHCRPERFPASFIRERDTNLKEWLVAADRAFSISGVTRNMALHICPDFKEKIKIIPLGLEKKVNSGVAQTGSVPGNDSPVFFFPAGGINMHKNIHTLFAAAAKAAEKGLRFQLVITAHGIEKLKGDLPCAGHQDEKARLYYQENKALLEKHLRLVEFCSRQELEDIYGVCRCVVLPSILENSSLWPFIEAIERGIPVITSDIEETKEYIDLYQCRDMVKTFSSLDAEALSRCLEDFIMRPIARIPPDEANKRFSHWTCAMMAREYVRGMEHGETAV